MIGKRRVSVPKLSSELGISRMSIQRIVKDDLGYYPYKKLLNLSSLMSIRLREKGSRIGLERISAKSKPWKYSFWAKNSLTLMVSTILKTTESGHRIVRKLTKNGAKYALGGCILQRYHSSCHSWTMQLWIMLDTSKKFSHWLCNTAMQPLETIGNSNRMKQGHTLIIWLNRGAGIIS